MNMFNARLRAYILSSRLDKLINLSFCLRANGSEFVLVHWVLLKYIGSIMRIASATSGREFVDPRGHGEFTARVGLNTGKGLTTDKGTCSDHGDSNYVGCLQYDTNYNAYVSSDESSRQVCKNMQGHTKRQS